MSQSAPRPRRARCLATFSARSSPGRGGGGALTPSAFSERPKRAFARERGRGAACVVSWPCRDHWSRSQISVQVTVRQVRADSYDQENRDGQTNAVCGVEETEDKYSSSVVTTRRHVIRADGHTAHIALRYTKSLAGPLKILEVQMGSKYLNKERNAGLQYPEAMQFSSINYHAFVHVRNTGDHPITIPAGTVLGIAICPDERRSARQASVTTEEAEDYAAKPETDFELLKDAKLKVKTLEPASGAHWRARSLIMPSTDGRHQTTMGSFQSYLINPYSMDPSFNTSSREREGHAGRRLEEWSSSPRSD